ncbi:MAG TPA: UbiA family prenyltransferase [Casimicrobiaceae bacterium]|nr:UbiA family prenyltransferase [Casimicrobiaceae bacterium]
MSRLLSSIRIDEVIVLQGAPLLGVCFAIGPLTPHKLAEAAIFTVASLCLVAHVFAFNDWSGIHGDLRDPNRAARTFQSKGITRAEAGLVAAILLLIGLLLFGLLGTRTLVLALAIAALSALYSAPAIHLKGMPLLASVLHLAGGTLHFLLGYALFAAIDTHGVVIGCFFGLVFAAGHLMHEVRDFDGDRLNGIRTNAVAFGKARVFGAGVALFTAAYALLIALAASNVVPRVLLVAAALGPVHLWASLRAWRSGLDLRSLRRLQRCYRLIYAVIGIVMAAGTLAG